MRSDHFRVYLYRFMLTHFHTLQTDLTFTHAHAHPLMPMKLICIYDAANWYAYIKLIYICEAYIHIWNLYTYMGWYAYVVLFISDMQFGRFDRENKGHIDFGNFRRVLGSRYDGRPIEEVFHSCDTDGDGFISKDEVPVFMIIIFLYLCTYIHIYELCKKMRCVTLHVSWAAVHTNVRLFIRMLYTYAYYLVLMLDESKCSFFCVLFSCRSFLSPLERMSMTVKQAAIHLSIIKV